MSALVLPKTFSPDDLESTAELAAIVERLQPHAEVGGATGGAAPGAGPTTTAAEGAGGLRDLPTATDSLRHKLQHARAQLRALPDMGRTVAEQEAEIRALEMRREKQQAVLAQLRGEGARFAAGEQGQKLDRMEL